MEEIKEQICSLEFSGLEHSVLFSTEIQQVNEYFTSLWM
jgi:hypothetical protein